MDFATGEQTSFLRGFMAGVLGNCNVPIELRRVPVTTSFERIVNHDSDAAQVVRQLSTIPSWLATALDADQVMLALNRHVPEFAAGALTLRDCAIDLLHLKNTNGEW